jgi:hypothetical protein
MNNSTDFSSTACFYIYQCSHSRSCTGYATEKAGYCIANALPNKFFVAVVFGLSYIVSNYRGKECINGSKSSQRKGGNNHSENHFRIHADDIVEVE